MRYSIGLLLTLFLLTGCGPTKEQMASEASRKQGELANELSRLIPDDSLLEQMIGLEPTMKLRKIQTGFNNFKISETKLLHVCDAADLEMVNVSYDLGLVVLTEGTEMMRAIWNEGARSGFSDVLRKNISKMASVISKLPFDELFKMGPNAKLSDSQEYEMAAMAMDIKSNFRQLDARSLSVVKKLVDDFNVRFQSLAAHVKGVSDHVQAKGGFSKPCERYFKDALKLY